MDEFERRARRGEISPHALVSIPALTGEELVEARSLPLFAAVYDPRRLLFRRHFHLGRIPWITMALCVVLVGFWWAAKTMGDGAVTREALMTLGAKARARVVDDGEAWRLLVASLLHKDGTHLAFNLLPIVSVCAALEGVYRRGDYVLLLVLSGLSCMVTSTIAIPLTTVGASGMIFGCLGCAVVFGLRFADVLAWRYRLLFGVVVVGYTAATFFFGLMRVSTDNWGHAGGIVCGAILGAILEPRLLRLTTARESLAHAARPWIAVVVVIVVVVASGAVIPRFFRGRVSQTFDAFGLTVSWPEWWARGTDPLGLVAYGNGVDAIAAVACVRKGAAIGTDAVVDEFVHTELYPRSRTGQLADLVVGTVTARQISYGETPVSAKELAFTYVGSDGPFTARALLFGRGEIACAVVTQARTDASPVARAQLDEILASVRLSMTEAQIDASRTANEQATSTKAWLAAALAHQTAGDIALARNAFLRAAEMVQNEPSWTARVALARATFELDAGKDKDAAVDAARAAVAAAPADADAHAVVIAALNARGGVDDGKAAAAARTAARARFPFDKRFEATP